jgi:hypothetical protein
MEEHIDAWQEAVDLQPTVLLEPLREMFRQEGLTSDGMTARYAGRM